jgi:hypothetical protein
MSSAAYAFSSSGSPAPQRKHRPGSHATSTSAAADAAIRQMVDRRRQRHKYGSTPGPRPSAVGGAIGSVSGAIGDVVSGSIQQLGLPQWTFRAVFVGFVAAVLGWAVFMREGVKSCAVDGVLLLEGKPVANATLTFLLPGEPPADGRILRTDGAGAFRTDAEASFREGLYTVVIQPPKPAGGKTAKQPAFPKSYTDPATTPLRVQVSDDLTGLKLLVRR